VFRNVAILFIFTLNRVMDFASDLECNLQH
jgi:hypothetical protein